MNTFHYQIPPPPFPSHDPTHTIHAYDRFHGTLDGSWRGGWGNGSCGTFNWQDPFLRESTSRQSYAPSLADYRRREGASARKQRLKKVWHSLPANKSIPIHSNYDLELLNSNRSWSQFCQYAFNKESQLWNIYKQLDVNGDMKLDKHELRVALKKASINLDDDSFNKFFSTLDQDNSGVIEFADFRDYLLLLPRHPHITEIYRYYTIKNQSRGASQLTSDADVILSADESTSRSKSKSKLTAMSVTPKVDHDHDASHSKHHKHIEYEESIDNQEEEEAHQDDNDDSCTAGLLGGSQAIRFLLAGGIAGAVSRTSTAPFDRLKVYLITTTKKTNMSGFSALYSAMQKIYVQGGGVTAFWVGNGLNIVKIFPESAIKFLSYETAKRMFAKHWDNVADQTDISGMSRFIAGGIGGITSQFVIYPVETVKTRMMSSASNRAKATILHTAKDIYLKAGPTAFYRGLPAGLFGVFPYSAIDMSTFEALKLASMRYHEGEDPSNIELLACGSVSGSIGATSVYPLNLLRTRLQASGTPAHPQSYTGFFDVLNKTYANEGVRGFYRGLIPTLAKVVPAVSISYLCYENAKRSLGV
ncbi:hypothetical protein E3P99_00654 [Wallemia hederae]|uniref:EF-hand domain-containing protein n=1 Tax=Wallemia hederae TaxID=1540922 RepID=A0A4T0FVH7_9BASI|nr:hypothetical protein E3P99_00654 [Wallemia hederae]